MEHNIADWSLVMDSGEVEVTLYTGTRSETVSFIVCSRLSEIGKIGMTALHQICPAAETMLHFRSVVSGQ